MKVIIAPKWIPIVTNLILELKLRILIFQSPDITQKCFCIQNEAMDISFQKNMILALEEEYYQRNKPKTNSNFFDTPCMPQCTLYTVYSMANQ